MDTKKICVGCQQTKMLTEFHRRSASPDGYDARCKTCRVNKTPRELALTEDCIRIPTTEILEGLGYNVDHPTLSIYEQFKIKMKMKGVDISGW